MRKWETETRHHLVCGVQNWLHIIKRKVHFKVRRMSLAQLPAELTTSSRWRVAAWGNTSSRRLLASSRAARMRGVGTLRNESGRYVRDVGRTSIAQKTQNLARGHEHLLPKKLHQYQICKLRSSVINKRFLAVHELTCTHVVMNCTTPNGSFV